MLPVRFTFETAYTAEEAVDRIRKAFTWRDTLHEVGLSMAGAGYYRYARPYRDSLWVQWHLTHGIIIRMNMEIVPGQAGVQVKGAAYLMQPNAASISLSGLLVSGVFGIVGGLSAAAAVWVGAGMFILIVHYQNQKLIGRLARVLDA